MLWTSVFLLALAVAQVPAKSAKYLEVNYIENVAEPDSRIVSGWEAQPGQHPHHANLRMTNPAGVVTSCGGSVVHHDWVITAAHCTALQLVITVRAGLVQLADAQYVQDSRRWFNHPTFVDQFVTIVQPNDIALIELPQPIVYSATLLPIAVQSREDAFRNYDTQVLYASGHGRTWTEGSIPQALQWVYLRGLANARCQSVFGGIITANTVCAQFFNQTSQSTCHGDSGGPLVFEEGGVATLVGVTSFVAGVASGGCHSGHPAGFIRTGPFHSWFTQVTGLDFERLDPTIWTTTSSPTASPTVPPTDAPTPPITWPPTTQRPWTTTWNPFTTWSPPIWLTTSSPIPTPTFPPTDAPTPPITWLPTTQRPWTTTREPSTTWLPPTWGTTNWAPPTVPVTEPEPDVEPEEEEPDSESESDEDPELSELLKKLEVQVKVKVKLSKYGSHKEVHHNKTSSHNRHH